MKHGKAVIGKQAEIGLDRPYASPRSLGKGQQGVFRKGAAGTPMGSNEMIVKKGHGIFLKKTVLNPLPVTLAVIGRQNKQV